jgi:hypothetical protein
MLSVSFFTDMLNVIMVSAVLPSVAFFTVTLSIVMLTVAFSTVMLSAVMLTVAFSTVMLSVVMLDVIMVIVVAPLFQLWATLFSLSAFELSRLKGLSCSYRGL